MKVGKWGGDGGYLFDMGAATRVVAIRVRHGAAIDAIQILYESDGSTKWTPQYGGNGGELTEVRAYLSTVIFASSTLQFVCICCFLNFGRNNALFSYNVT